MSINGGIDATETDKYTVRKKNSGNKIINVGKCVFHDDKQFLAFSPGFFSLS